MIERLKSNIRRNIVNARGWRTDRKIIVIESDDWGMIRMASSRIQKELRIKGYKIHECPYNSNDRIESDEDIKLLREVLLSVKDKHGNPAKFTLNNVVANPDFRKIKNDKFENYYYETFSETLKKKKDSINVVSLVKQGIGENIFQPQLHGREHINLRLWFERLKSGDPVTIEAFNQKMYTIHHSGAISGRRDNLDAFGNTTLKGDSFDYIKIIKEAQQIFHDTWGFKSTSFIAPCYVWHPSVEKVLKNEGVKYIQGTHVQRVPIDNYSFQVKRKYHYMGQKNKIGQFYLVRNCFFEPAADRIKSNIIDKVLNEIKVSFRYKKPAIISSHRVNYIGSLNPENRSQNLMLLEELLQKIIKLWPDVEFMSSDQLGSLITKNK